MEFPFFVRTYINRFGLYIDYTNSPTTFALLEIKSPRQMVPAKVAQYTSTLHNLTRRRRQEHLSTQLIYTQKYDQN